MKELRIEARVRNNVLYHAIFNNYNSVSAFCAVHKMQDNAVGKLLNLKASPKNAKGKWKRLCIRLAEILKLTEEELFPEWLYKLDTVESSVEISFNELPSAAKMLALASPDRPQDDVVSAHELEEAVYDALRGLTPREERIIKLRYLKGLTQEEVAQRLLITRAHVAAFENKALRRLRHPRHSKLLARFRE